MKHSVRIILVALCLSGLMFFQSCKKKEESLESKTGLVLSVNAYSFNSLLLAKDPRDGQPLYSMFNLLEWCALQNIPAVDLTGYYFPGYPEVPSDEYIFSLKKRAEELGVQISGTGIRNDFASPDPEVRAAGVALAKEWIVVASKLGAPVIRLFAGKIPTGYEDKWDEVAEWMVDSYREVAVVAEDHGVIIGIQNHGGMLHTADQCIKVIEAVDSEWAGIIVDIGNFKTDDPYVDIEAVVPYAVNWQVKESVFGTGSGIETDYLRLAEILHRTGYKGSLPVESLKTRGMPYDPFAEVSGMMKELNDALNQVYQ
jgi:sugar phosphate isomerase/epimerase